MLTEQNCRAVPLRPVRDARTGYEISSGDESQSDKGTYLGSARACYRVREQRRPFRQLVGCRFIG